MKVFFGDKMVEKKKKKKKATTSEVDFDLFKYPKKNHTKHEASKMCHGKSSKYLLPFKVGSLFVYCVNNTPLQIMQNLQVCIKTTNLYNNMAKIIRLSDDYSNEATRYNMFKGK